MVFNNKEFDLRQLLENIKLRIASWYKANWSSCNESVCNPVRFPNLIKASLRAKAIKVCRLWIPPPNGFLKFNGMYLL